MENNLNIDGHINEFNQLLNSYEKKFPHSWIFFGPKGSGKYNTFLNFVKTIYLNKKNYLQNLFEINGDDDNALIDDVRNLISKSSLTNSNSSKLKSFFVIKNAESLNFNSLNALLKTIEEPPINTIIIIITNNLKKMPRTIISRCVCLYFNPLNSSEFNLINRNDSKKDENFRISNFNPKVYKLIKTSKGEIIKDKVNNIIMRKEFNSNEINDFYDEINNDYENNFELTISVIFDYLKNKFTNNFDNSYEIKKILICLNTIQKIFNQNLNVDKKKILNFIFSEIFNLKINK
tara:strand:+ start:567 stop:1439 length:873 start_codon:yes stop_codon:yes gene_type:complete